MAVGLLFVVLIARALVMPAQNDSYYQLRAGQDIVRTRQVSLVERYSYTAAGRRYGDHEWLSQAAMYLGYRAAGMPGIEIVAAGVILAALLILYRLMVGPPLVRLALMAAVLPLSSLLWVLRPQIASLLGLMVLVWLIVRERFWLIPLLFLVWANAHGGVAVGGIVLGVAFAVTALRSVLRRDPADRRRLTALGIVLPLAALATAATPLGFHLYGFIVESAGRGHAINVVEWQPLWPNTGFGAAFWAIALAFGILLTLRRRAIGQASWADWILVGTVVAFTPIAVQAMRNFGPFLFLVGPAASRLLGPDFRLRRRPRPPSPDHPALNLGLLVGGAVIAAVAVVMVWRSPPEDLDWHPIPQGAITALRGCDGPLYNHYDEGGYLIWFAPERPVFIDSRQDPYPLPFILEHVAVERKQKPYRPLFARWGIRCAFLSIDSPTAKALAADHWTTRYRDEKWTVLAGAP
jgi:hypothetical protein